MDKEVLNTLIDKYKLSKEEHDRILIELINKLFSNKQRNEFPQIVFVIGQPGSGKTTFINNIDLSEYTIINSDEYRKLINNSAEIFEKYPTLFSKITNPDAHLWGDELFTYGINNGFSVLREKVPVDLSLLNYIKKIPSKENITIDVIVTGNLTSLLATRERYEREYVEGKNPKLSNIDAHNKCYDILPEFISMCKNLGVKVNYIIPSDNEFMVIDSGDDYLTLLEKLRKNSNEKSLSEYQERISFIKESMRKRKASLEEYIELEKINKIYMDLLNIKNKKY